MLERARPGLAVFLLGGVGIVVCFVAGIGGIWSTGLVIPYGGVWSHICLFVNLILRAWYVLLKERRCVSGDFSVFVFWRCIFRFVNGSRVLNYTLMFIMLTLVKINHT